MSHKITSQIDRLSLHDSSFESFARQGQTIEMVFDWAKLENFLEDGFEAGIIMGKTTLRLNGVQSESFVVAAAETASEYSMLAEDIIGAHTMISTNSTDGQGKLLTLSGFTDANTFQWFDWSLQYSECEVSWRSFVTYEEWLNGKLPTD